ncbi:MAG: SDR family oxidoreductase, partial [Actinomycetota bacterium]|nr:SDR family oxidoreductase [Actinomycetota bacterium]
DGLARTPLGRLVTPDDVAATVDFLTSDRARMITGQTLCVDGGAGLPA